jgi:hypothetical protein
MRLREYISEDLIFVFEEQADKATLLRWLVGQLGARLPGISEDQLFARLMEREEQVTTVFRSIFI